MAEVLAIENASFPQPWTGDDFLRCLRQSAEEGQYAVVGMVAEIGDMVVGYMLYELRKRSLHLLNLAVHPDYRRMRGKVMYRDSGGKTQSADGGVGACLLSRLMSKLSNHRRARLTIDVGERNLEAQLFLRNQGFRCTNICPEYFTTEEGESEDGFHFCYKLPMNVEELQDA